MHADTIYVRAFEDRTDLLRAAMVGAAGTPYHDGLFFFDMQLPPSYPAVPPLVHYHSYGLWLNPNLDDTGGVCLSLLDAAGEGPGPEHWSPARSSVLLLQLVVSLQGLVLTAQPYYNEPDYAYQATSSARRRAPATRSPAPSRDKNGRIFFPYRSVSFSIFFRPFPYLQDPVFVFVEVENGVFRSFLSNPVLIRNRLVFIPFSIYAQHVQQLHVLMLC
jgi:ubiquitin-protein ligase